MTITDIFQDYKTGQLEICDFDKIKDSPNGSRFVAKAAFADINSRHS